MTNAGLVYHGLHVLGQGATLAGIVLGAIMTFILDRKLVTAVIGAGVGAALSFVGLLHADQVGWAAAPGVALGYPLLALMLLGIDWLRRNETVEESATHEPESVDPETAVIEGDGVPAAV